MLCLHSSIIYVLCVKKNALDLLLHFCGPYYDYNIEFYFHMVWKARYRLADFQKTWSWCLLGTFSSVLWNSSVHRRTEYGNLILLYILYTFPCIRFPYICWFVQFVDPVIERLDTKHCIRYRLSRPATKYQDGKHFRVCFYVLIVLSLKLYI